MEMVFWKFSAVSWSYTMDIGEKLMLLERKVTKNVMNSWRIDDKKANPAYICYLVQKIEGRVFCWLSSDELIHIDNACTVFSNYDLMCIFGIPIS